MRLNNNVKKIIILGSTGMMGSVVSHILKMIRDFKYYVLTKIRKN